jgi:hypothetical protein
MHISNQSSNSVDVRLHLISYAKCHNARNTLQILVHVKATVQNIIILLDVCDILLCQNLIIAEPTFNYWPLKLLIHHYNYELNKKHQMKNTTQKC